MSEDQAKEQKEAYFTLSGDVNSDMVHRVFDATGINAGIHKMHSAASEFNAEIKRLLPRVAIHLSNGLRQRNPFGASVHTVLRVGAFLNSPGSHDRREPLALVHRSRGMHIEKPHLADDRRSHELVMLIHLRTNFQAVPARDAI